MSNLPARPSIQNLELEQSQEVQLYLELIRVIEKDIDEINASTTRSGWTSWAIVGAIAGALLFLFGETRKLQTFPTEDVTKIGLGVILLYYLATWAINTFSMESASIRPGRIRWSTDMFFPYIPTEVYRLLLFLGLAFLAFTLSIPWGVKLIAVLTFSLISLVVLTVLIVSIRKYPLGNAKNLRKFRFTIPITILPLSFLTLVLLITQMRPPLGEAATLPYILAGLVTAIIILIENLISTLTPSRLFSNLQDLKNDIIFLRIEIDEALQRYEVLKEGETLPDALKEELGTLMNDINTIEYAYSNMDKLLDKLTKSLPEPKDLAEVIQQKQKQFSLDKDSYALHQEKCGAIQASIDKKVKDIGAKLNQYAVISGDFTSAEFIRLSLLNKLQGLLAIKSQLDERFGKINYYMAHPGEIPTELRPPLKGRSDSEET